MSKSVFKGRITAVLPEGGTLVGDGSVVQRKDGTLLGTILIEETGPGWRPVFGGLEIRPKSIRLTCPDGRELISDSWMTINTRFSLNPGSRQTIIDGMLTNCTLRPLVCSVAGEPRSYVFYLSNLMFVGTQPVTTNYRQSTQTNPSRLDLDIGNYEMSLRRVSDYDRITRRIQATQGVAVTTQLRIRPPRDTPAETIYTLVENVCTLLSLGSSNHVTWIEARHYGARRRWSSSELMNGVTRPYTPLNLIDLDIGAQIKSLVERGLPKLTDWDNRLSTGSNPKPLRNAIRMSLDAKRGGTYLQSRALAAVIVVELLNSRIMAESGTDKIISNSKFKRIRKIVKDRLSQAVSDSVIGRNVADKMVDKIPELNRPSFQQGIDSLLSTANLNVESNEDQEFLLIRNSLVHTGDFIPEIAKTPVDQFWTVLEFVDRILLALVGYEGNYLSFTNGWKPAKLDIQQLI